MAPQSVILQLIRASRPVLWVAPAFSFAAAYLTSSRQIDVTFVLGTLFFLFPYNLALYGINDVCDDEADLRNPRAGGPHGVLIGRRLHAIAVWAAILTCTPFLMYLTVAGPPRSWLALAATVFAMIAYSAPPLRWKNVPFLDSLTSSMHFVLPAVYALTLTETVWTNALMAIVMAHLIWVAASHAFTAVQDIESDREIGVKTIATVNGAGRTVRFCIVGFALAGLIMVIFTPWPGPLTAIMALVYIGFIWPYRSVSSETAHVTAARALRFVWMQHSTRVVVTVLLVWWVLLNPT